MDVCFVTVNATQLASALDRVPLETLADALLVPYLNGVEHVAVLRDRFPSAPVAAATIRVESTRVTAGVIEHSSPFAAIEVTTTPDSHVRVQRLTVTFSAPASTYGCARTRRRCSGTSWCSSRRWRC